MCRMVIVLLIACFAANTATALPGSGTQQDPWRIESLADFNEFAADPNYWAGHTRLETDVNLPGLTYTTAVIAPDVNNSNYVFDGIAFTGVLDGNEHKIINLTVDDGGAGNDFLGLFGCIGEPGQVSNLGLEGGSVSGDRYVGSLAGENDDGVVFNCYSTGAVNGIRCVGGLVGWNALGSVSNSYSTGDVTGDRCVGGLVGWNLLGSVSSSYSTGDVNGVAGVGGLVGDNLHASISNCYSTGDVIGTGDYVGGLVGYNDEGISVSHCYSTGSVSGDNDVGGLVGYNYGGSLSNCYSKADVSGDISVGGLVGSNFLGTISDCHATGDVTADDHAGGLVGWNEVGSILNCYSTGDVNGLRQVGGLVGWNHGGSISNSYCAGDVNGFMDVGGLAGANQCSGSISNSFWDTGTQTHGVTKSIGGFSTGGIVTNVAGLPTAKMQTESTFTDAGWDFEEIWNIGEKQTYPYLRQYPAGDLNHDGSVDLRDFAIFAEHWLEGTGS